MSVAGCIVWRSFSFAWDKATESSPIVEEEVFKEVVFGEDGEFAVAEEPEELFTSEDVLEGNDVMLK